MPVVFLTLLTFSQPASLATTVDAPRNWSIGAGVGFCVYDTLPSIWLWGNGLALGASTVQARMTAERRLVKGLWLMLQANATYSSAQNEIASFVSGSAPFVYGGQQESYGGMLGLRYQFDLAGIIELSPYVLAGGAFVRDRMHFSGASQSYAGGVFRARVGFAAERELVRGLSIRLATNLVEARYASVRGTAQVDGMDDQAISASYGGVGLAIEPAVELRMRF